jgi:hypothetical protein
MRRQLQRLRVKVMRQQHLLTSLYRELDELEHRLDPAETASEPNPQR